mmetsp:Transcript_28811/g.82514  ORF Transcript_28811/g.82514 Transcript_28811/m.82514 type:complete len:245 (+) Transcript_28811:604-1338(+)
MLAALARPWERCGATAAARSRPPAPASPSSPTASATSRESVDPSASLRHLVAVGSPACGAALALTAGAELPLEACAEMVKRVPGDAAATTRWPATSATAAVGEAPPRPAATSANALAMAPPSISSDHSPRKAARRLSSSPGRLRAVASAPRPPASASAPAGPSRCRKSRRSALAAAWRSEIMMCLGAGCCLVSASEPAALPAPRPGIALAPQVRETGRASPSRSGRCSLPTSSNQKRRPVDFSR